jgi:glucose-1-phosphate cytidylyltransferase
VKLVILAGGFGTRLSEETNLIPKPMLEIGGKPILWHIMKYYSHFGVTDFVILGGYKSHIIKEYFYNYRLYSSDIEIDLSTGEVVSFYHGNENWKVRIFDTGLTTMTGGRLKHARSVIGDETFLLTYGDGLSNVDINKLIRFHNSHSGVVTITSVQPEGRYGALDIDDNVVNRFIEKPSGDGSWVNGGFFVCNKEIFDTISGPEIMLENEPFSLLANEGLLYTFKHYGFWKCMDTLRDKQYLNNLWDSNKAEWKIWN